VDLLARLVVDDAERYERNLANKWLTLACNLLCEKLCGIRR